MLLRINCVGSKNEKFCSVMYAFRPFDLSMSSCYIKHYKITELLRALSLIDRELVKVPISSIFFIFLSYSIYHPMNFCERKIRFR